MNSENVALALERWATKYNEKWEAEEKDIRARQLARDQHEQRQTDWLIHRRKHPKSPREETMTDLQLILHGTPYALIPSSALEEKGG